MRIIDLIVDADHLRLIKASGDFENEIPALVRGDDVLLRIRFVSVDRSSNPYTIAPVEFAPGTEFAFAGKASLGGPLMVYSGPDKWNQGLWEEEDLAEGKCSCHVNFNGASLLSAIGGQQALRMFFDISARLGDHNSTLLLLDVPLANDVLRGDETIPDPVEDYATRAEMLAHVASIVGPGIQLVEESGKMAVYVNGTKRGEI